MTIIELLLSACALAMDAFAVSLAIGIADQKSIKQNALKCGYTFGFFQALMTAIGWLIGITFFKFIQPIDHYIAFILLSFIGIKMIYEAYEKKEQKVLTGLKMLIILAIATSIDALAAGLSFSTISQKLNLFIVCFTIGITTFILSYIAVKLTKFLCNVEKIEKYANIIGGIVLILIGVKILIEHLIKRI